MKYSKIRVQDEPERLEWWKKKFESDEDLKLISVSEVLTNKGTNRYCRIFASVAIPDKIKR